MARIAEGKVFTHKVLLQTSDSLAVITLFLVELLRLRLMIKDRLNTFGMY